MESNVNKAEELQLKIGKTIEKIRTTKEVTAKAMADSLGLTLAAYRNIERGITEITFLKIVRIAEILQVNYKEILEVDGSNTYQNNNSGDNSTNTAGTFHSYVYNQIESGYKIAIQELKEQVNDLRLQNRELLTAVKKTSTNK